MIAFRDTVFMCQQCKINSGYGKLISITYSNTGGYSPAWEGILCEHLYAENVLTHLIQMERGLKNEMSFILDTGTPYSALELLQSAKDWLPNSTIEIEAIRINGDFVEGSELHCFPLGWESK